MKKYFIITLAFTLLLTSCFKKEETIEKSTGNVSTSSISTGSIETKTETLNTGKIEETGSSSIDFEEDKKLGEIIENGENVTYKDNYKGYEVSFKKSEDFVFNNNLFPIDFTVTSSKTKNTIGFIKEKLPENYTNFDDYFNDTIKEVEEEMKNIKDFKKEPVTFAGFKGYKLSFTDKVYSEQYILSEGKDIFIAAVVLHDRSSEKQFLDILKGLKKLK